MSRFICTAALQAMYRSILTTFHSEEMLDLVNSVHLLQVTDFTNQLRIPKRRRLPFLSLVTCQMTSKDGRKKEDPKHKAYRKPSTY